MMKRIFLTMSIAALCSSIIQAGQTPLFGFIDEKFDPFLARFVAPNDQKTFAKQYDDLVFKHRKALREKGVLSKSQTKRKEELMQLGWDGFTIKHPEWSEKIKPYVSKNYAGTQREETQKVVRKFLFRFGVYEDFLRGKAQTSNGMMAKARSYVRGVGGKVAHWFGGLRKGKAEEPETKTA